MTGDTDPEPVEQTDPAALGASHDARAAALDRIAAKLERLSAQRMALRKAMLQFGRDFDAKAWSDAFVSPDADEINRVLAFAEAQSLLSPHIVTLPHRRVAAERGCDVAIV